MITYNTNTMKKFIPPAKQKYTLPLTTINSNTPINLQEL